MSNKKPLLPTDANGVAIQIPFHPNQSGSIPISTASSMISLILQSNPIVRITADKACFYKPVVSSGNAATTDHYLPSGVPTDIILRNGENRIAVCAASSLPTGTFYFTERT